jgi:choline dehydrogenase-like flavoprotein
LNVPRSSLTLPLSLTAVQQGTASMLPREEGGVVDPALLVYGTSNVRVVDLSVMPIHLSTHPQSVAYAIAEKAAEIILKAAGGPVSVVDRVVDKLLFQNQQPV